MSALTASRVEPRFESWDERVVQLADGQKVYAGGMACLDTAQGYWVKGAISTTLINAGVFQADADNTSGADGDVSVNVKFHKTIRGRWFLNGTAGDAVAAANRGSDVYILDDQTVSISSNGSTRSKAGRAWEVATIDGQSCVFVEPFSGSL